MKVMGGEPCTEMVSVLDCDIGVSELELHYQNHVHFRIDTHWKSMNPFFPFRHGLNKCFPGKMAWYKITHEG